MGIDFWYYLQWQQEDGEWKTMDMTDGRKYFPELDVHDTFHMHFPERGFYKTSMARILGYPTDTFMDKRMIAQPLAEYKELSGKYRFFRTLEQLEGIFRSKRICDQIEYADYKMFRLFLVSLRMDQKQYNWKQVRLVVATNYT